MSEAIGGEAFVPLMPDASGGSSHIGLRNQQCHNGLEFRNSQHAHAVLLALYQSPICMERCAMTCPIPSCPSTTAKVVAVPVAISNFR